MERKKRVAFLTIHDIWFDTERFAQSKHAIAADKGIVVYVYEGLEIEDCLRALENNMGLNMSYVELDSDIADFKAFVYD